MKSKKIPATAVIRGQREEIQAQDLLIDWLLQQVERPSGEKTTIEPETETEVCHGHD